MIRFLQRKLNEVTEDDIIRLAHDTGIETGLCRLLCMRGITDKKAAVDFLTPSFSNLHSPFLFSGMGKATECIEKAKNTQERVCIYGDYDVDGICATSILYTYLKYYGLNITYYIPSRKNEGYGMHMSSVERLHEEGVKLIITVDNGITAHAEIQRAYELGMRVLVTDHHICSGPPPECEAVLCHTVEGETYPNKSICGAGTALKLVHALGGDEAAMSFMPFAGLATVSDIVDLTGENRIIVSLALKVMSSEDCPVGLKALIDVSGLGKRGKITAHDISFGIGPRLNAAGRMETADIGTALLCETDYDKAMKLAGHLDELNTARRDEQQRIVDDADAQIREIRLPDTRILVLKSTEWNPGILGTAASKVVNRYRRPCILFSEKDGILTGSSRTTDEINIYDALYPFRDMYTRFGGHSKAAGLTMSSDKFEEFKKGINDYIISHYPFTAFIPTEYYDCETSLGDITLDTARIADRLAPFGEGNPEPALLLKGASFWALSRIGSDYQHLNGKIVQGKRSCDFAAFYKAYMYRDLVNTDTCDMLFMPSVNTWMGKQNLQLVISEFLPSVITDTKSFFRKKSRLFSDVFCENLGLQSQDTPTLSYIDDNALIRILKSSFDGTLILSTDSLSAALLAQMIQSQSCFCDIRFTDLPDNFLCHNTLVCAPDIAKIAASGNAHGCYRIVLSGLYSDNQVAGIYELFPDAEIVYHKSKGTMDMGICREYKDACSREFLKAMYLCFTSILKNSQLFTDELMHETAKYRTEPEYLWRFSLKIFLDLHLFLKDKNGRIVFNLQRVGKTPLTDSVIYNSALSYEDMLIK